LKARKLLFGMNHPWAIVSTLRGSQSDQRRLVLGLGLSEIWTFGIQNSGSSGKNGSKDTLSFYAPARITVLRAGGIFSE